ncbi:MAG: hypothetical protein ABDH28_00355 [Brevinematia bacterium]
MVKKIFLCVIAIIALNVIAFPLNNYEHFYSFQSPYSIGIGKATTAIEILGTESFMANPASFSQKFSFELLLASVSLNHITLGIINDLPSLLSGDQNLIISYAVDLVGKPINFGIGLGLLSFNIPIGGDLILRLGINSLVNFFFEIHNPLSSAGFIDLLGNITGGGYIGASYSFKNISTGDTEVDKHLRLLSIGINLKMAIGSGIVENTTLDEIVLRQVNVSGKDILSNLQTTKFIPDIGILYKLPLDNKEGNKQRINIALSVKDIGGFKITVGGNEFTLIPTTFNLGVAYFIDLYDYIGSEITFRQNYISLDFHDLFFQRRDKDFFKRIHIGLSSEVLNFIDLFSLNLGVGLNGGYPTLGVALKFLGIIKLSGSVYTEELGVYAGQDPDVRYLISASIGW